MLNQQRAMDPSGRREVDPSGRLEVVDLAFTYMGQPAPTIAGVNFAVQSGEMVAIAGPTGSGKSTILNCIAGIAPHHTGGKCTGEIRWQGDDMRPWSVARRSEILGILLQNVETQIFCDRVADELVFGLENRNRPPDQIRVVAAQALSEFGLEDQQNWPIRRLSAGQKQRQLLACLLTTQPPVLLLDEPFAFLDTRGTELLVDLLKHRLNQGQAIILIEHRLELVQALCDRIYHIQDGQLNLAAGPVPTDHSTTGPPAPSMPAAGTSPPAIAVQLEQVSYSGYPAFPDLTVHAGEVVWLKGNNGCGKTTLLRLIAGLIRPETGEIQVCGRSTSRRPVTQIAQQVGFVLQNPNHQLFAESVRAEVHQPGTSGPQADQILAEMNLTPRAEQHPHALSQGQKRRLALAAVLARQPQICLLDEIMVGQDPTSLNLMLAALHRFTHEGGTLIFTSHDPAVPVILNARIQNLR